MSEGFDINKSKINDDTLNEFLSAEIDDDLTSVPGIGLSTVYKLSTKTDEGDIIIETTKQLIGLYLTLCAPNLSADQQRDAFWWFLKFKGVNQSRNTIVHAISEKVNIIFPN